MPSHTRNGLNLNAKSTVRALALAGCMGYAVAAGGCGGAFGFDGVELQGGLFDAMGVSGSGQKRLADKKVDPRPGLVLPPSVDRLPEPVTGSIAAAPAGEAWPVDPEDRRAQNKTAAEKQHREFCERAIQDARMRNESGVIMGPLGNCQPGLLGGLAKQLGARD
jgi:hypothetical protein